MKKIISLFCRNYDGDKLVRDEIVPGAEWVLAGEGVATRKWDGTAVMVRGGKLFKRYDAKQAPTQAAQPGQSTPKIKTPKAPPAGFEPCQDPDPITGHWPGWVPVGDGPEDKWFRYVSDLAATSPDGTYELCGPHFQANPECFPADLLVKHGDTVVNAPRDFKAFLAANRMEGIVWHHPDGRMVKIKASDFGFGWGSKAAKKEEVSK